MTEYVNDAKLARRLAWEIRRWGDPDDFTQEIRIRLWQARQTYDPAKGGLFSYLYTQAKWAQRNLIADCKLRKNNVTLAVLEAPRTDNEMTMLDVSPAYDSRGHIEDLLDGVREYNAMTPYMQKVTDRVAAGETLTEIAAEEGLTKAGLHQRIKKGGVRPQGHPPHARKAEALARFAAGETKKQIAKDLGVNYITVLRWTAAPPKVLYKGEQYAKVKALLAEGGHSFRDISRQVGVSPSTIKAWSLR